MTAQLPACMALNLDIRKLALLRPLLTSASSKRLALVRLARKPRVSWFAGCSRRPPETCEIQKTISFSSGLWKS